MRPEDVRYLLRTDPYNADAFILRHTRYHLADHLPITRMGIRSWTFCGKEEILCGWANIQDHTLLVETESSICIDCLALLEH